MEEEKREKKTEEKWESKWNETRSKEEVEKLRKDGVERRQKGGRRRNFRRVGNRFKEE